MSPFHLNRSPQRAYLPRVCVHTVQVHLGKSRTLLPAALLPAYLTFAFCLFLPLLWERRNERELGGNLKRLPLSPPTRLVLCVIDVGLV